MRLIQGVTKIFDMSFTRLLVLISSKATRIDSQEQLTKKDTHRKINLSNTKQKVVRVVVAVMGETMTVVVVEVVDVVKVEVEVMTQTGHKFLLINGIHLLVKRRRCSLT
jgi:hypothetical protein